MSTPHADINGVTQEDLNKLKGAYDITKLFVDQIKTKPGPDYEFADLVSWFPKIHWSPLEPYEYKDKGIDADPEYKELFAAAERIDHLTPKLGTVLYGVQLADLTDKQKDQLARLVAYRGTVFFRNQDKLDIKTQLALGRYYGKLHRHPLTAVPRGAAKDDELFDVHVIWGDENKMPSLGYSQTLQWHADASYEEQPPAYTMLKLIQTPPTGGDTSYSSGYGLYDLLSPGLQQYLETHTALHSAVEQARDAERYDQPVRRDPVVTEHPMVRVHPVTGYKSVYVNPGFTRCIVGVPGPESEAILNYLYSLIATNATHSIRWRWQENDVAVWDNRIVTHAATYGCYPGRRHGVRVTVRGEKPYYDEKGQSQENWLQKEFDIKLVEKDGSKGANYND